ncbi:MAG: hypothetical protein IKN30_04570 [Synergistaceae bacterium]|nr:hypothetical protein [Synergistaceae bacterium]
MQYKFFGWQNTADIYAVSDDYKNIKTPFDLYNALLKIWCEYSCAPRMRNNWSEENITLGQCSITAFLAQDIFGGKVYGTLTPSGDVHCFNVVNGVIFDLTSEQFGGEELNYTDNQEQSREKHFSKLEKKERYEYIKRQLKIMQ